jgi:hypothetical protein
VTREEKIQFAIWLHDKLIDKFPEIYKNMKKQYLKEKK